MFYECNRGNQFLRASSATRGAYFDKLDHQKKALRQPSLTVAQCISMNALKL